MVRGKHVGFEIQDLFQIIHVFVCKRLEARLTDYTCWYSLHVRRNYASAAPGVTERLRGKQDEEGAHALLHHVEIPHIVRGSVFRLDNAGLALRHEFPADQTGLAGARAWAIASLIVSISCVSLFQKFEKMNSSVVKKSDMLNCLTRLESC